MEGGDPIKTNFVLTHWWEGPTSETSKKFLNSIDFLYYFVGGNYTLAFSSSLHLSNELLQLGGGC